MEANMNNNNKVKYPGLKEISWFGQFTYGSNPWMARYVYGLIFLITNLLAWAVRDYGRSALTEMERLTGCEGGSECLGTEGVLRVSLGCFLFFFVMFLTTVGTSKLHDHRDTWHSGWWSAKALLFVLVMILPFLVPNVIIQLYGNLQACCVT